LRHIADPDSWFEPDLTAVRLNQAQNNPHQGGFTRAVRADQSDDFAGADLQMHVLQDRSAANGEIDARTVSSDSDRH
jgi:hypothetical protein